MTAEVLFVRVAEHVYEIGPPGASVVFEPRVNGRPGMAIAHAVLAERGRRVDVTRLMPPHQIDDTGEEIARKSPRACATMWVHRARKVIGDLSPALRTVLESVEYETERVDGDLRVYAKVPLRSNGVVVRT